MFVEVYELRVDEGVFDVFVSEESHDVENILGLMVFHGGFPVAKSVKGYSCKSWVLGFCGYEFSASFEDSRCGSQVCFAEPSLAGVRE